MFRTIYVPIENAINVPENFNIDIGTSFGGNVAVSPAVRSEIESVKFTGTGWSWSK